MSKEPIPIDLFTWLQNNVRGLPDTDDDDAYAGIDGNTDTLIRYGYQLSVVTGYETRGRKLSGSGAKTLAD